MSEYKEGEESNFSKTILLGSLKNCEQVDFGKPNLRPDVSEGAVIRCFELFEMIDPSKNDDGHSILYYIKKLDENISFNKDIVKILVEKIEFVQLIGSVLNTESKEIDDICIKILKLTFSKVPEKKDELIISLYPFANSLLYILHEKEHFFPLVDWLIQIVTAKPETATLMFRDDAFKEIFQMKYIRTNKEEVKKEVQLLFLLIKFCDKHVLGQRAVRLTPIIHTYMGNDSVYVISKMIESLISILQIDQSDVEETQLHGVDFYLPIPIVTRILGLIEKQGIMERTVKLMKTIVIRDINSFIALDQMFKLFDIFVEHLVSSSNKIFDNIFVEFIMNYAMKEEGAQRLVKSEKIPTLLYLDERLEFKHKSYFYIFFLQMTVYAPKYMVGFSTFSDYFDEIVETLTAEIPEILLMKFFEAVDVLKSDAYTETMETIDRENLIDKLNELEESQDQNVSEHAKDLLEFLDPEDDDGD